MGQPNGKEDETSPYKKGLNILTGQNA